jgi:hypothetical protein
MHATLLWTINDFSAYENLSGWSTKGNLVCPVCNKNTMFRRLKFGFKRCYMGYRRFLPQGHIWRKKKKKSLFDGTEEHRMKPNELSGDQLLHQLKNLTNVRFGKDEKEKSRKRKENELNWTKNNFFFFNFPYWSTLKLRHNLDVMHIEKNICDSVLGTSLNIDGKTNDTFKDDKICV